MSIRCCMCVLQVAASTSFATANGPAPELLFVPFGEPALSAPSGRDDSRVGALCVELL